MPLDEFIATSREFRVGLEGDIMSYPNLTRYFSVLERFEFNREANPFRTHFSGKEQTAHANRLSILTQTSTICIHFSSGSGSKNQSMDQ